MAILDIFIISRLWIALTKLVSSSIVGKVREEVSKIPRAPIERFIKWTAEYWDLRRFLISALYLVVIIIIIISNVYPR